MSMTDRPRLRPAALTGLAAMTACLLTLAVSFLPAAQFAYRNPSAHVAIETADGLVASLVAFLLYGRFRRARQLRDLLLVYSLGLLAVGDLVFSALPAVIGTPEPTTFASWAPLSVRLASTLLLCAAALAPSVSVRSGRGMLRELTVGALLVVAVSAGVLAFQKHLPQPLDPQLTPELSGYPRLSGHPLVLALQVMSAGLLSVACVAFTARAERTRDELLRWLGAAAAMSAFARVNYSLFPSIVSDWVYTGDLLRVGFSVLLLVGASREIRSYWVAQTELAVFEERRRLARELHDGVVQELGYIRGQAQRLRRDPCDAMVLDRILGAAERGVDESRRAIAALTEPMERPVAILLAQAADEVTDRYGVNVGCRVQTNVEVGPHIREDLIRILREAVSNAARHGAADRVAVMLGRDSEGHVLEVRDDGRGFDPRAVGGHGFGLISMRDRAAAIGGTIAVESAPGMGTSVRVRWT